jgi:peptidyl-prolyl cis-trans isomerase D
MLAQLRSLTRGFVAWVLLGLLIVAFAIWGVNDVFSGAGGQNLAEVGNRKITPAQLAREMELTLRGERERGNNVSQQDAIDAGLHTRLLEGIIARNAMYAYAEKIGVSASDAQVADRIRQIPAVLNPVSSAFDETAYAQFLGQLRYSRAEFEEEIRGEITAQMLLSSLVAGVRAPTSFGALAYAYDTETRVVTIAEAPASVVGTVPTPTEAQLQAFWEENADRLRIPEYRALTLVYARPQDFIARVDVPEQRLREEFDARRAALVRPERRTYVRLSAQNEAQANDAAARLARGESPDAVATALGAQVTRGENQARTEVPDPRVAEAVFTTAARAAPRVVRGQLTPWAVIRVESITPATEPSFADMRDDIRNAIAGEEAAELLNTAIGAFEDARAGGAAIADAARQAGLPTLAVPATDAGGRDQRGQPIAVLAEQGELLSTAFETAEGEASDFLPAGDADVVVSVDRVIAESVRPLADVRDELAAAWQGRERGRLMRELGATLAEAVRGGQSFDQAARANRFAIRIRSAEVNREQVSQIPASGVPQQIFAGAERDVVTGIRSDGGAVVAAYVERINRPDLAAATQQIEANRVQFQQGLAGTVGEAVEGQIVAQARVRRNEQLLSRTFRSSAQAEEDVQQ